MWCNLTAAGEPDPRLCHRACPVPSGHSKFGLNIWVSDVTQQAHAVSAPTRAGRPRGAGGVAGSGAGLLAPLLNVDPADTPPPPPAAVVGLRVRRAFDGHAGSFVGEVRVTTCNHL